MLTLSSAVSVFPWKRPVCVCEREREICVGQTSAISLYSLLEGNQWDQSAVQLMQAKKGVLLPSIVCLHSKGCWKPSV